MAVSDEGPSRARALPPPCHGLDSLTQILPAHPFPLPPVIAPDVTGLHDLDEFVQSQLILAAMTIVTHVLKPGGAFVAKVFRGKDVHLLYSQLKCFFPLVTCAKPRSSRNASIEAFIVCQGYAPPPNFEPRFLRDVLDNALTVQDLDPDAGARVVVPFVACGDLNGWDADKSYEVGGGAGGGGGVAGGEGGGAGAGQAYVPLAPVQPPIAPPYKQAIALIKHGAGSGMRENRGPDRGGQESKFQ